VQLADQNAFNHSDTSLIFDKRLVHHLIDKLIDLEYRKGFFQWTIQGFNEKHYAGPQRADTIQPGNQDWFIAKKLEPAVRSHSKNQQYDVSSKQNSGGKGKEELQDNKQQIMQQLLRATGQRPQMQT
jgi:hypothetical protein